MLEENKNKTSSKKKVGDFVLRFILHFDMRTLVG
jgi:hypothetical protein